MVRTAPLTGQSTNELDAEAADGRVFRIVDAHDHQGFAGQGDLRGNANRESNGDRLVVR